MAQQSYSLQITFQYNNGEKESFLVALSAEEEDPYPELRRAMHKHLSQRWCAINTSEETIYINMANVTNVSVKPDLGESDQEKVFPEAQRVTALTRNSKVL